MGGATYHVSHPGGRSYDVFPVSAAEAESRRGNRFTPTAHTPGPYTPRPEIDAMREFTAHTDVRPMSAPAEESYDEYPLTLDLRTQPKR